MSWHGRPGGPVRPSFPPSFACRSCVLFFGSAHWAASALTGKMYSHVVFFQSTRFEGGDDWSFGIRVGTVGSECGCECGSVKELFGFALLASSRRRYVCPQDSLEYQAWVMSISLEIPPVRETSGSDGRLAELRLPSCNLGGLEKSHAPVLYPMVKLLQRLMIDQLTC
jgi:hypothetical protein